MTRTEKLMTDSGYYAEATFDTRAEADGAASDIERCGQGQATWVRRSQTGWTLWIETDKQHEARGQAGS
jgi:hypothetical protein